MHYIKLNKLYIGHTFLCNAKKKINKLCISNLKIFGNFFLLMEFPKLFIIVYI